MSTTTLSRIMARILVSWEVRVVWRAALREWVLSIGREGVLVVGIVSKGHHCASRRCDTTGKAVAGIRHHARRIALRPAVLRDVAPVSAGVSLRMARSGRGRVAWIVVGVFQAIRMDGLGPSPSPSVIARQCGSSTATSVTRRWVGHGDCVPRGRTTGYFGWSRGCWRWRRHWVMRWGSVLVSWAGCRVRGLDLVNEIPAVLVLFFVVVGFVFVFVVLVVLLGRGGVDLTVARVDLDTRRVFVFAIVFAACVVVDSDSFPKFDGNVSVAFHVAGWRNRNAGRGC
jgi:hypothetical protein